MKKLDTEILVIGGGATGTGILRDLALRGFRCLLVEKRDLAHGTTGRYHGLLHSGGRYVVKDPQAARECIVENRILRRIMPFCIEDTGGFFVTTPWDDPAYADRFIQGCHAAKIPVEEVSHAQMLKAEPLLNPEIHRCLRVPDASADSFLAAEANIVSARQHGAQALTYLEVKKLVRVGNQVTGAVCYDLAADEEVQISADLVVSASGAWAGKIAGNIGVPVQIKPGKGTMVAINHRILNTVVNRCKMPSDGDIIVPAHTVAVIGTTDEQVSDPDHFSIEPWEIRLMLDEGEKLVPGLRDMRMLRAWAGVRPLYQETAPTDGVSPAAGSPSRDITRAYVLLDHAVRDGVSGFLTITSGKWTTYRMMAEATVDKVCAILKVNRSCRTHQEILPSPQEESHSGYHWLGGRLAKVEQEKSYGGLICECELASEADIIQAITKGAAKTIDDIRRDTRLGMGPCQGGFCTLRVAGLLHQYRSLPVEETNAALRDFLQERWKGLLPVLWGQQLRQERLDELIYLDVLNVDHLPGVERTRLASENYAQPEPILLSPTQMKFPDPAQMASGAALHPNLDAAIIGAGLAGLSLTWQMAAAGTKVRCISKGWGAHYWAGGCVDVLGYSPQQPGKPVLELVAALQELVRTQPQHPYALCGLENLNKALQEFQALTNESGYPLYAVDQTNLLAANWLLPNTAGALRPTCLAPATMTAGNCRGRQADGFTLLVGFSSHTDFHPHFAAANLSSQGFPTQAMLVNLPALNQRNFVTSRVLAQMMAQPEFRQSVVEQIKTHPFFANHPLRIGFPAVLGLQPDLAIWKDLQERLGCPVFELPGLPPSIPGMRLHQILLKAIEIHGGHVYDGMQVTSAELIPSLLKPGSWQTIAVLSEAAARQKTHRARQYVLATGGILGGGFSLEPPQENLDRTLRETIFNLPLWNEGFTNGASLTDFFRPQFLHPTGHPIFNTGVKVNAQLQPVDPSGNVLLENVAVIGSALAGTDALRERSQEGIALVTAFTAARHVVKYIGEQAGK